MISSHSQTWKSPCPSGGPSHLCPSRGPQRVGCCPFTLASDTQHRRPGWHTSDPPLPAVTLLAKLPMSIADPALPGPRTSSRPGPAAPRTFLLCLMAMAGGSLPRRPLGRNQGWHHGWEVSRHVLFTSLLFGGVLGLVTCGIYRPKINYSHQNSHRAARPAAKPFPPSGEAGGRAGRAQLGDPHLGPATASFVNRTVGGLI